MKNVKHTTPIINHNAFPGITVRRKIIRLPRNKQLHNTTQTINTKPVDIEPEPSIDIRPLIVRKPITRLKNQIPIENTSILQEQQLPESIQIQEQNNCVQLFDPCTQEPTTLDALEKRIRDIKKQSLQDNPEVEQFPSTIHTRLDLLIDLLNRHEPPGPSLFKYTINGQLYEAYWDIVFALNLLDTHGPSSDFVMINKKAEHIRASNLEIFVKNPIEYLRNRNVNEGASGASDISFCYKNSKQLISEDSCSGPSFSKEACVVGGIRPSIDTRPRYYFCSSKFYKKDSSKSAESFDIQKIYTAVKTLHQEFDVRIILLVKDKDAVDTKLKNARNKYISEEACETYGEQQLYASLLKLYNLAKQKIQGPVDESSLKNVLGITDSIKPILSPRLHQHIAILKIQEAIRKFKTTGGENNKFLVGILPRGGKTYIAGGIVSVLQPKRVVVLLGAKSETISQFTNDLFRYYQDFSEYEVIDVVENLPEFMIDSSKKYIFVMSVELYKMESSTRSILAELKSGANRADLFICDEAHLKQTTEKAIRQLEEGTVEKATDDDEKLGLRDLDKVLSKDVPVVFMTGTYIKPLTVFNIPENQVAIWEYQDIQEGKNIVENEQYFKDNFPGIYEEALAKCISYGESLESIQAMYRRFPNLYLLSTQFTEDAKTSFLQQSEGGEKVGFPTVTHLFQVKKGFSPDKTQPSEWHTGFTNPLGMARLINYLSPKKYEIETIDSNPVEKISSVMTRIDRISQRIGDRLAFFTKDFVVHSQLWFLPSMQGHKLINRMTALAGVIFKSSWYRTHFNVLAVSSSADWSKIPGAKNKRLQVYPEGGVFSWACPNSGETLKECILREEATARAQGKGLVILAQNMLHLGISLTCVDIVVLLDAGEKVDERIQKMYRALTESTNKKGGFIIDLNYFRTVTAIMQYQIQASKTRLKREVPANSNRFKDAFNSVLETYSIDDDLDIYGTKEEGGGRITSETLPELQRMFQAGSKGRGDQTTLSEVGEVLNRNVEGIVKNDYDIEMNALLGSIADDSSKRVLRTAEGIEQAEETKEERENTGGQQMPIRRLFPNMVAANPVEKKKAFIDIFKTTLKLGIFGTTYKTIPDLLNGIRNDPSLREIIYDTLIKRGVIDETADPSIVFDLIIRELEKVSDKKGDSYSDMKEAFNTKDFRSEKIKEVLDYIVTHLAPKDKEREKFGEVFTPLELVDEMLSKLPQTGEDNVWNKKNYKWLDPANGIGNFPIKAFLGQTEGKYTYPGLLEGLSKEIPNDQVRCKYIIENMLFMIDINGKNNLIARKLFEKLCPGATPNIEQIDKKHGFLTKNPITFKDKNGKLKELVNIDIIMGNPPFNAGGRKSHGDEGANTIWPEFVKKANILLKDNGYLLFLHPPQWRVGKIPIYKEIYDILMKNQILYLKSYEKDIKQSDQVKFQDTDVRFEFYLMQKTNPIGNTVLIDIFGKETTMLVNDLPYIPNAGYTILSTLYKLQKQLGGLKFVDGPKVLKGAKGQVNKMVNMSSTNGIDYIIENIKYIDQEKCKVCTNGETSRWPVCFVDKGGATEDKQFISPRYILCDTASNGVKLANFLSSKLIQFLIYASHFQIQARTPDVLYRSLPDITSITIDFSDDEQIYRHFKVSKTDIEQINKTVKRIRVLNENDLHIKRSQGGGAKTARIYRGKSKKSIFKFTRKLRRG